MLGGGGPCEKGLDPGGSVGSRGPGRKLCRGLKGDSCVLRCALRCVLR